MTTHTKTILRQLRSGLNSLYGPRLRGVYLFGSYARGEEDAESDLDVLIILDQIPRYGVEIDYTGQLISELSLQSGISISRVFVSEQDWAGRQTAFLANAREEAIAA